MNTAHFPGNLTTKITKFTIGDTKRWLILASLRLCGGFPVRIKMHWMKWLIALLALFCLAGCHKQPSWSVVGTWVSSHKGVNATWHFFPDGKLLCDVDYRGALFHTVSTYHVDGDVLSADTTEVIAINQMPDTENIKSHLMGSTKETIHWNTPGNFQLDPHDTFDPFILAKMNPNP